MMMEGVDGEGGEEEREEEGRCIEKAKEGRRREGWIENGFIDRKKEEGRERWKERIMERRRKES